MKNLFSLFGVLRIRSQTSYKKTKEETITFYMEEHNIYNKYFSYLEIYFECPYFVSLINIFLF